MRLPAQGASVGSAAGARAAPGQSAAKASSLSKATTDPASPSQQAVFEGDAAARGNAHQMGRWISHVEALAAQTRGEVEGVAPAVLVEIGDQAGTCGAGSLSIAEQFFRERPERAARPRLECLTAENRLAVAPRL